MENVFTVCYPVTGALNLASAPRERGLATNSMVEGSEEERKKERKKEERKWEETRYI